MKTKKKAWGLEVELTNGRFIYVASDGVETNSGFVHIKVNDGNVVSVPKTNIKKILLMANGAD